ncbi:MAG: response regulator [Bacteroidetes bacterium]|jgi:CheY-like chemotaxis protein|nr:response regulator [Bacteroidota bacterium]
MLTNKSILVIEDDLVSFELLKELLEQTEAKITHVTTGHKAVEIFDKQSFDAVLLDIKIPGIDGFELARRFKLSRHEVPIIAQTAMALQSDKLKCLEAGCDEYVPKPIKISELQEKLMRLLS